MRERGYRCGRDRETGVCEREDTGVGERENTGVEERERERERERQRRSVRERDRGGRETDKSSLLLFLYTLHF